MTTTSDCVPAKRTVLIAHPCADIANRLADEFVACGWFPLRCTSAKVLHGVLEETSPSLLVTELRLADGLCLPALKRITRDYPALAVIVVTGHASAASAVEAHRCGIHAYLQRGASAADILAARGQRTNVSTPGAPAGSTPSSHLDRLCWEYINRVVMYAGSVTQAAELMGLDRRSLRRMLSSYAPPGG